MTTTRSDKMSLLARWKNLTRAQKNQEIAILLRYNIYRPDYLNDLNAMHDACRQMWTTKGMPWQVKYNHNLYQVIGHHDHMEHEAIHATAMQRAEAFYLTEGTP